MSAPGSTSLPPSTALPAWAGLFAFGLGVASMFLAQAAALRAFQSSGQTPDLRTLLVAGELGLALPALVLLVLIRPPLRTALAARAVGAREALLAGLVGAALWVASLGLMQVQATFWPPTEEFLEIFRRLHAALRPRSAADALLSVAAIALVPALCEELVLRGALLPSLVRRATPVGAVLVSAILFGLIHVDAAPGAAKWFRVPFTVFVGGVLGALRLWSGSLLPPVLAHAVLNTITFSTVALTGADSAPLETQSEPALGAAMFAAGTAATAVLFRAFGRR